MDAKSRQAALDSITADDLAKIQEHRAKNKSAYPVDDVWLIQAEFAKAYGWHAYLAVKNDEISFDEMMTLVEANRKLEFRDTFRASQAAVIGAGSAQSKTPGKTFAALTKVLIKNSEADS